jgi:hypothetical protein
VIDEVDIDVYYARLRASTPPGGWRTDPANPEYLGYAMTDNLTSVQRGELWDLTVATVSTCLAEQRASWDACVAETETVVDARFAAMGGELVPNEAPVEAGDAPEPGVAVTLAPS